MKTDIEIAQESVMQPIAEIAEKLGYTKIYDLGSIDNLK